MALKHIKGRLTDLGIDDDQFSESLEPSQVSKADIPDACMTQVECLEEWKVTEQRQILVFDTSSGQRHHDHIWLPDAVAAERLDTIPSRLCFAIFRESVHLPLPFCRLTIKLTCRGGVASRES